MSRPVLSRLLRAAAWIAFAAVLAVAGLFAAGVIGHKEPFMRLREIPRQHRDSRPPDQKVTPQLREIVDDLVRRRDDTPITVLVEMSEQVNLREMFLWMRDHRVLTRRERRKVVLRVLDLVAAQRREAGGIEPYLEELRGQGLVVRHDGFSVVNRVAVTLRAEAVDLLAQRPDVAEIVEERGTSSIVTEEDSDAGWRKGSYGIAQVTVAPESWAIDALEARTAWDQGIDGRGVVVGLIDTGVRSDHDQLRDGWRGGANSWYDPRGASTSPVDTGSHGTQVLSCAVGRNVDGKVIGVAPGASWIAAAGLRNGLGNNIFLSATADWILNEAQPDVLICAFTFGSNPFDDHFVDIIDAWRAAEINVVFSAGNAGPGYATNHLPANTPYVYPVGQAVLSVGATAKDGSLYRFSSEGPNAHDMSPFPQLVAPGEDLTVAFPLSTDAVISAQGTSMAVAYIAGVQALMLQAYPDTLVNEMDTILRQTATDAGPPGLDNKFGYGFVTVPKALEGAARQAAGGHSQPLPPKLF